MSERIGIVTGGSNCQSGIAEIELESHFRGEPFKFSGSVVDFKAGAH
jgi:hypothetical protein